MKREKFEIINNKGVKLHAHLELPANQHPNYYAIFAHCFSCNSDYTAVRNVTRQLTRYGFGVVRFDFTGLGRSEGEFSDSHFSANIDDLIAVNNYLAKHYKAPSLLIGHSLGGAAAIVAASKLENIIAVATIGAPSTVHHVTKHFSHQFEESATKGDVKVNIGGRPFKINQDFVSDFGKTDLPTITENLRKAILILHSPLDETVHIDNAQELYIRAKHPKSFISLDSADHLLTNELDSRYVGDLIGTWVQRYFPEKENQLLETEGEQVVGHLNLLENNFTTHIQTKKHSLIADEPISLNGDEFGPSPYEYVNAGLAACTVMTIKLYAERKKWDLEEVYVYLSYSKKDSKELKLDLEEPRKVDYIEKKIKFVGNLDEKQQNRLTQIADRCPVQKTLQNGVFFDTEIIS